MPLIVLEIFLGFGVPLTWAVYELVSLRREQRRDREKAEAQSAEGNQGTEAASPPAPEEGACEDTHQRAGREPDVGGGMSSRALLRSEGASGGLSPGLSALLAAGAYAVPLLLSRSTSPTPDHPHVFYWYRSLRQPAFKPPDVVIPIAWTLLDSGLAIGAYRLLRQPPTAQRNRALGWLGINVLAIGGWSRLFFGGRNLPLSTLAAAAMVGTGAAYVAQARQADRPAAVAGIALTTWVGFATVLTAAIWRRNR